MFDLRDEAVRALTRNTISVVTDVVDSEFWEFSILVASHSATLTHVEFKKNMAWKDEAEGELRKDIAALTSRMGVNSRVLWDFTGLQSFSADSISMLVSFNKDLKHRGSRLVLCCLEPEVQEAFFANRRSCSP